MFVPPQFRENEDPPTSRAVLSKKEDGSVELSFPDLPSAEPIKIAEPTMLAIRERPKPNPKPASTTEGPAIEGSASKTPAHGKNSKKRAATKSPDMGVFELGMHDAKREDNGTHEDKTVSMDKYWKGKAAEMNIDPEDMEIPQGTDKGGPFAPYEGSVSGIPPLSNEVISQFLKNTLPKNNKARMWIKAQEAAELAKKQSKGKEKVKETLSAAERLLKSEPPQRENPLIARINEMERKGHWRNKRGTKRSTAQRIAAAEKMQAEKKGGRNASTAKVGSSKSAAPARKNEPVSRGPSMDHAAVRKVLAEVRAKEGGLTTENADEATDDSATEPVAKANALADDIPLEFAKRFMQEREFQAGIINSIDEAQHRLLKTMYGDDYPKPKARPFPFEENDPRPPEGFADLQREKAYHTAVIDHVEQARLRLEGTMSEMRAFIEKNRKERMESEAGADAEDDPDATEDNLPEPKPSTPDDKATEPMGIRRTPEAVEKMEKEREIDPEAMKRVQNASMRLQRALFGDEIPKVNYNKKKF